MARNKWNAKFFFDRVTKIFLVKVLMAKMSLITWNMDHSKWILMASYSPTLHSKDWLAAVKKETSRVWNWCILLWVTYPSCNRPKSASFACGIACFLLQVYTKVACLTVYSMATLHAMSGQIKLKSVLPLFWEATKQMSASLGTMLPSSLSDTFLFNKGHFSAQHACMDTWELTGM